MVTQDSAYTKRLGAWLTERFPAVNFISGAIMYLLAKAIVSLSAQTQMTWSILDLAGCLIPALHLFLLRVFDEHKDFKTDMIHYPNRVVQRGIFTLKEIQMLGIAAFILQLGCLAIVTSSAESFFLWGVLWAWTLLMWKEFFVGERLKNNLFLYAFLHQLVTPLLLLLLLSVTATQICLIPAWNSALFLSVCTGALYELSRKIKGREEETNDLSYSKLWGVRGALLTLSLITLLTAAVIAVFFEQLGLQHFGYRAALVIIMLLSFVTYFGFLTDMTAKARKKNEGMAALIAAYGFLVPFVVAVLK